MSPIFITGLIVPVFSFILQIPRLGMWRSQWVIFSKDKVAS